MSAENMMLAQFMLPAARLTEIQNRACKRAMQADTLKISPMGNGALSTATGPTGDVMFLIGAVADEGEDALYKAELL